MVWFIAAIVIVVAIIAGGALIAWAERKGSDLFDNPPRFTIED